MGTGQPRRVRTPQGLEYPTEVRNRKKFLPSNIVFVIYLKEMGVGGWVSVLYRKFEGKLLKVFTSIFVLSWNN